MDLDAPRKQRHTVKRIFDRLIDEHAMVDVSYQVVQLRGTMVTCFPFALRLSFSDKAVHRAVA
ncbi:hypothetical protein ALI144C_22945 [Actinosynnema sp. ALI-1.44]|nr:hypothetical protein ALI144C_22945 [Actinosynnema sp. ALI-1.44]